LSNLSPEQARDSMLGQINLAGIDTQRLYHFAHGFLQNYVQMINLVLLRMHLPFDSSQRGLEQMLLPFFIPYRFQVEARRVGDALDWVGAGSIILARTRR